MLLFELGMMFEAYSTDSAKRSIKELIDIRPEYATRKVHGKEFKVDPSALKLGHIIVINRESASLWMRLSSPALQALIQRL